MNCRKCKDMMIEALYGELRPAERDLFDAHLGSCPDCASEYSVLGATLRVMDKKRTPDPGPEFWAGYWDRLAARMDREGAAGPARPPRTARAGRFFTLLPRWSYRLAAGAALLVVGILIGRWLLSPPGTVSPLQIGPATSSAVPVSNDPAVRARQYIERSQILLLGLVNFDPKTEDIYALDLPRKKEISREMVAQAADIRDSLTDPRQKRLRELVSDLQVIMMQIANLGAGKDLEGVDIVRQGIEQKGIFLKIDLTRMALNARGPREASPRPGR
ncbi:MAG: zf-HC2 domain-containing protein, partial [Candidatus Aminicenantales bacterium]